MSSFRTLIQKPIESMKDFNARLAIACAEAPITDYEASVVDGLPALTLISELVDVDQEMIAEAAEEGEKLSDGDVVPDGDPMCIQVCALGAIQEISGNSEARMDVLNTRADGDAIEVEHISGPNIQWIPDRNDVNADGKPKTGAKYIMVQTQSVYAVVSYGFDPDADADVKGKRDRR